MLQFIDLRHANNLPSLTQNNIFKILDDLKAKYIKHMQKFYNFQKSYTFAEN